MRVPYEWIKELLNIHAAPAAMAEKLTMIGLEVEGAEEIKDDIVFEVNVTPNRPDCLSMIGIARELSAAFKAPMKIPPHHITEEQHISEFFIEIRDPDLCCRYAGRLIKSVRVGDSPEWIKARLEKCGIRSINNIVDITNYVLLEFGHPLHAFDADTISGKKIIVGTPRTITGNGEPAKMRTLDGAQREVAEDSLLIWDSKKPIAVAGVMGGAETEVSEKTRNIFLESAYFEPSSIRRTSKILNLTSESSYRFERGTDIELLENALNRAALLISEIAGGTVHEIIDIYPVRYMPEPVRVRYEKINKVLGINLSNGNMLDILERLGIRAEAKGDVFIVFPPAHRRDIMRESDVAEEIARIYGYNGIPVTIPRSPLASGRLNNKNALISRIRDAMRKAGFTEVINYSFIGKSNLDLISIPENDRRRRVITINNPLSQEGSLLRTTLIPSLIANLQFNMDRGGKDIRFFEISKIFQVAGETLPLEELRLGGIYYKDKYPSLWKEDAEGFFMAKGTLESMFDELKIRDYSFSQSSEPFLHMGKASDIYIENIYAGYLGVMGPDIIEKLDLKKQKPEVVLFELNLDLLFSHIPSSLQYTQITKYPSVERDVAIVVDETIPSARIMEIIREFPTELIGDVSVFDSYKGGAIPSGKKSLAFNIIFRSKERTLRDDEVEELHASLVSHIIHKTGGELR